MNEQQYINYLAHMLDEAFNNSSSSSSFASRLENAKINQDDEFYTTYDESDLLLRPFSSFFRGKKILMNCDDPMKSQMFRYMEDHFDEFGLKELKCVGYGCTELLIVTKGDHWDTIPITNGGDFRTGESLEALKECDIIVSNPPFSRADSQDEYSLGQDFFRLAIEHKKDVIGINDIVNINFGILKEYILNKKLKVYQCPYTKFDRPENPKSKANSVKCVVLSTIKNISSVSSGLKINTMDLFNQANSIGLQYNDLPDFPLSRLSNANDKRVDVKILNLVGYKNNSIMPIPSKPSKIQVAYEIQRPKIAIPYFWGIVLNWEKYFKLIDIRRIKVTLEVGEKQVKIDNSYCIFEYK